MHKLQRDRFQLTKEDATAYDNETFRSAAVNGHFSVLQWLTDRVQLTREDATADKNKAFRWATYNGHLLVLRWLADRFQLNIKDESFGAPLHLGTHAND